MYKQTNKTSTELQCYLVSAALQLQKTLQKLPVEEHPKKTCINGKECKTQDIYERLPLHKRKKSKQNTNSSTNSNMSKIKQMVSKHKILNPHNETQL